MSNADDELQHLAPLPWSTTRYGVWDAKKRAVLCTDIKSGASKQLLEMVVRAVNAHDELVAILDKTRNAFASELDFAGLSSIILEIDGVLAKARGETKC